MKRITVLALLCALAAATGLPAAPASTNAAATEPVRLNAVDYTGDVIYQIVTDRFVDGDPSNNPPAPFFSKDCKLTLLYCGGDWKGIASKITDGYLPALGISAILVSVPVENIMVAVPSSGASYHGYWPRDLKRHNPAFGTMDDFRALLAVAHAHGIKVMIDFVINQTSPGHEGDDRFADDARLYDDGKLLASFNDDEGNLYHHYGETDFSSVEDTLYKTLYDLADIDQQKPAMDAYLKSAIKVWLDAGIDGIRVDTVKHVPVAWQRSWVSAINAHRPVFTAGEWYMPRYETDPRAFAFANDSGMSVLDFTFSQTLRAVFRYQEKDMTALDRIVAMTAAGYAHPLDQVTFLDNHDQYRMTISDAPAHHRLVEQALALSLTSRGTPMIYYGTEQYMQGAGHEPLNRAMMTRFERDTPAFVLTSRLAALRKSNAALRWGSQQTRYVTPDVYVHERRFHGSTVLVAINRGDRPARIETLATSLPCAGGVPARHADVLDGREDGNAIDVGCDGRVAPFTLAPRAIAVWASDDGVDHGVPELGHAAPVMAITGAEITLTGRHFGHRPGRVVFDGAVLDASVVTHWDDGEVRFRLPAKAAGKYAVAVQRAGLFGGPRSETYGGIEVLAAPPQSLRVVVDGALAAKGEKVYMVGDGADLGENDEAKAAGPMFDKVLYRNPTWYADVSVPSGTTIGFRFLKKNAQGVVVARESGPAHSFAAPQAGVAQVRVKLNGWTPAAAQEGAR